MTLRISNATVEEVNRLRLGNDRTRSNLATMSHSVARMPRPG
jgi:hypothetical protein